MAGRVKVSEPVCSSRSAPPCLEFEQCIEFKKQRSSVIDDILGRSSLTQAPLWPYCLKFQGDAKRLPVLDDAMRGLSYGKGLPLFFFRDSFGSNKSRVDGPPCMKRKMTLLAFAMLGDTVAAEDSVVSIEFNASDPNPMLLLLSISLLLRGEG